MTTIDFAKALQDAKGATFEALPVGDYDVEVAKAEAVTSSNGKPMIKTTMKVVAGPYERRPIVNNFVLSLDNPQAVAIFFRHMKCFGITEEFFASLGARGSLEPVATALTGRRARLTLGHREWNGETRNEVKTVKPYTGAPPAAGPAGPGSGFATPGPTPPTGPSGPTPPTGPGTPLPPPPAAHTFNQTPTPTPVAPPTASPVAPTAVAQPTVQPMPQPPQPQPTTEGAVPVAVPTSTVVEGPSAGEPSVATSAPSAPPPATSESVPPVASAPLDPPKLPF